MKRLFIDTEFTDFINTELISIGIISEDGQHEFYAEINDFRLSVCSDFVKQNILPSLDLTKHGMSRVVASARLYCWLEELGDGYVICPDNSIDWELLNGLLEELPKNISNTPAMMWPDLHSDILAKANELQTPNLIWFFNEGKKKFKEGFDLYFTKNPIPKQHHALADAKANRDGWFFAHDWLCQHY